MITRKKEEACNIFFSFMKFLCQKQCKVTSAISYRAFYDDDENDDTYIVDLIVYKITASFGSHSKISHVSSLLHSLLLFFFS